MNTIRRDLVKEASKAQAVLGESAGLVEEFLRSQMNDDGGFKGRSDDSDLYYTMFGIEAMRAVHPEFRFDFIADFLARFKGKLDEMDMVNLCCYIRCMADVTEGFSFSEADRLTQKFATRGGGYNIERSAQRGTAYGCFLALGAFQDSGLDVSFDEGIIECIRSLKADDGGYANEYGMTSGSVPATAAAVSVLHYLGGEINDDTVEWLLSQVSGDGGFRAVKNAPVSDLLSTATGLFALKLAGADISGLRERCLDFVDSLWDGKGGFCGSSFDRQSDCEYTFYGLVALGVLK